jgi:hypothetical protein
MLRTANSSRLPRRAPELLAAVPHSHAPAWECILSLDTTYCSQNSVSVPTEDRGNQGAPVDWVAKPSISAAHAGFPLKLQPSLHRLLKARNSPSGATNRQDGDLHGIVVCQGEKQGCFS